MVPSPAQGLTQPQRVELSHRRLVEAAAELIAEKGWEATTAAEIGRRAGYSRAMVHARFGSKDAILDAFFDHDYVRRLTPDLDPDTTGLDQALAHFDHVERLYHENADFLRAMFLATFEGAKTTSALRDRVRRNIRDGKAKVASALRTGLADGSVRPDIDLDRAVNDISSTVFGLAYQWAVIPEGYDLARELTYVRDRFVTTYGTPKP
ncbi:TetR/AcrR family transcriptional regulator [Nocardia bovistercoris]|uniref:TetR/AcrR family transcriptional regulator n=1 Tax=Nocardia bovistercoris TaxID=2785916 RepID=A0A931IEX8_9NOCA|nr:TetR/AcrR family transcriptional regulator [Nocardia bovistercoris]MBH0780249.1 TetR/AcrR family transcriptional regulator [Nocardia bovistercoris]